MRIEDKFWEKVKKTDSCWIWVGAKRDNRNYGILVVEKKTKLAHRLSYEFNVGEIPKGLFVLHKCDNPPCVNPDHLFLGTQGDNMRDMYAKKRDNHKSGEKSPNAKLKDKEVIKIRRLWNTNKYIQAEIAKMFSLNQSTISLIINNKLR